MLGVFGYPGSGTTYFSHLLAAYGLKVRHERLGQEGIVSWYHFLPEYYPHNLELNIVDGKKSLTNDKTKFTKTIHLIRNPWKSIPSASKIPIDYVNILSRHTNQPELHSNDEYRKLEICFKSWVKWYRMVQGMKPDMTVRIEDLETRWEEVSEFLGIQNELVELDSSKKNSRKPYPEFNYRVAAELDAAEAQTLKSFAESLGYDEKGVTIYIPR